MTNHTIQTDERREARLAALGLLAYVVLMLAASLTLIAFFDFPEVLRRPVDEMLGLYYSQRWITVPAYYAFVLSGVVFLMMNIPLLRSLGARDTLAGQWALLAGTLFGLLSTLGFIRWPFLMKSLGEQLQQPGLGEEQVRQLQWLVEAFHQYAGVAVGENFAFWFEGFWMLTLCAALTTRPGRFPLLLRRIGILIGAGMLVYVLEQFGGPFAALGAINVPLHAGLLVWLLALAWLLWTGRNRFTPVEGGLLWGLYGALLLSAWV